MSASHIPSGANEAGFPADLGAAGARAAALVDMHTLETAERPELLAAARRTAILLQRANQELENLAHALAHDVRAPIRHIDGFTRLLEEQEAATLSPDGKRLLERFRRSADRMGTLIESLIDLSRLGRAGIRPTKVDNEGMARAAWTKIVDSSGTRAVLDLQPLPAAIADPALLRRLWECLLENAAKFSAPRESPRVTVDAHADQGTTWYRVTDNGVGFDERYVHKLFGIFQRLHRADEFPGTGIGLAIARKVMDLHGGSIRARGAVDRGAVFEFTFDENRQ